MNDQEAMVMCLRLLKVGSTATLSGTVYRSYPMLPFGIVACKFFFDNLSRDTRILSLYNDDAWKRFSSIKRHCILIFAESRDRP